jgi:hypothetical protein
MRDTENNDLRQGIHIEKRKAERCVIERRGK